MADGVTPKERASLVSRSVAQTSVCDKYYQIHKDSYDWFELSFDHFGRTSSPEQTQCVGGPSDCAHRLRRICQDAFQRIYDNGYLEEKSTMQLFCETDKRCATATWTRADLI